MELSPKEIEQKKAYQLTLRSKNNQDISQTSKLLRSLLFAELSMIAYLPPDQAKIAGKKLGFEETEFFNHDGSQA